MSEPSSAAQKATKVGAFTAACLLVSNAVGSGIFTTTGFQARDIGDPVTILALWAVGGALALAGAMSYGELGAALPRVGGEYIYLRRAFGPLVGFLSGWTSFTVGFGAAIAAGAMAFAAYFAALFPALAVSPTVVALVLVWSLTAVHLWSLESGGRFQRWITVSKIGAVLLGIGFALVLGGGDVAHLRQQTPGVEPGIGSLAIALIFVMYAFSGWNAASYIAGEMHEPARNLPRALVGGTIFVTAFYLVVNFMYFYALPPEVLAADPVLPVAEKVATSLFGARAAALVSAVLCLSIAGSTSSMIWAGPRVYEAMAADGVAPALLAKRSQRGVPATAIASQSIWISALLFTGTFEQLVVYAGFALAIFSALGVGSVIALRIREPDLERPYRVGLYPWVPLAYIAGSLWIATYATWERPTETLLSLATVAVGVPVYFLWTRRAQAGSPGSSQD